MTISKTPSKNSSLGILSWTLFALYSFFVYQGSVVPRSRIPLFFLRLDDKVVHGIFYFLLFGAALLAFKNSKISFLRSFPLHWSLGYCALMGAVTEISQKHVPGRSCDPADWASDMIGAVAGLFIYTGFKKRRKKV